MLHPAATSLRQKCGSARLSRPEIAVQHEHRERLSTADGPLIGSTPMDYRRLGSTGLRISRLVLGCGNFGGVGSAPAFFGMGETEAQAFELMDRAYDAGVNVFDTANA